MIWDGRIQADARRIPLADRSVQAIVTSPPYWGLRDYGWPDQIGMERTLEEYLENLRTVFKELWRVLRDDGTAWLNLGDCYHSGNRGGYRADHHRSVSEFQRSNRGNAKTVMPNRLPQAGLKAKDLVGLPWRVAFALQADGWWLRSDIVWAKRNCMPESTKDRPTRSHEYLFLLAKSERYYYDGKAIAEPLTRPEELDREHPPLFGGRQKHAGAASAIPGAGARKHSGRPYRPKTAALEPGNGHRRMVEHVQSARDRGRPHDNPFGDTRNKRDVWWLASTSYPEAHYATFPPALVEPCILAGSRPGDIVLDPFFGSGTVGMVAERLNRRWIGLDLGYQDLQGKRLRSVQKELILE